MARARILIVDDEVNARSALAELLREDNYLVDTAADGFKALPKLEDFKPDVVLTDLRMPGMTGLELLEKARDRDPHCVVLVATAYGEVDSAVSAMRKGAADYLAKPVDVERLKLVLQRELERRELRREAEGLRARLKEQRRLQQIVGGSPAMLKVIETILQIAPTQAAVLISGESGTGKELVATAIHEHSQRARGPFVKVNCASLDEPLLEVELFGDTTPSGAGARRREGRIEQAHHGTLFLDEVSEIPPALQVRLLRFLQDGELERVGASEAVRADVRVIAATHLDLAALVAQGSFRDDLYYRLNVVSISLPALRDRAGDVPILAARFLAKFTERNGRQVVGFSDEALEALSRYSWPGNVRELENAVERAVVVCPVERIRKKDLPSAVLGPVTAPSHDVPPIPGTTLAELERYAILRTLEICGGSTSRAAEMLGISPRKIQYKLHEYTSSPTRPKG
jgi:DNA-binding NtrC family response regulator